MTKVDDIIMKAIVEKLEPIISDYMKEKADCHVVGMIILDNSFYSTGIHAQEKNVKIKTIIEKCRYQSLKKKNSGLSANFKDDFLELLSDKIKEYRIEVLFLGFLTGDKFKYALYGDKLLLPGLVTEIQGYIEEGED